MSEPPSRRNPFKSARRRLVSLLPGHSRFRAARGAGFERPVTPAPDRRGIALVAIVKDEERYIGEWLDYHFLVGARHIFVYDNGSTDGTVELLRAHRFADRITVMPWRNFDRSIRVQNAAYNHALANFGPDFRWMAFIDVDEFIVPKRADTLDAVLTQFEDLPALSLPWHMFGSSGHAKRPEGLVIENYLERAEFPPRADVLSLLNYKTIADPAKVRLVKTHHVELFEDADTMWNDRKEQFEYRCRFDVRNASAEAFQLNHYFARSEEEIREKIAKGRVSKDGRTKNAGLLEAQVEKLQRRTVRDETILRFIPALRRLPDS